MSTLPLFDRSRVRILLTAYTALLLYFSLTPAGGGQVAGFGFNLLLTHAAAYMMLGILAIHAFPDIMQDSRLKILLYVSFFGIGVELLQTTVPGRYFSWADIGMNTVGAAVVLVEPELQETVTTIVHPSV